jgi:hypothetical protein
MKIIALMYHDVVEGGRFSDSGFAGTAANLYKLDRDYFEAHIDRIAGGVATAGTILDVLDQGVPKAVVLTFDDGGVSASTLVAGILEKHNWRGHFFVTTNFVGEAGFLDEDQIRDLHKRGHVIGSHSCSHPAWISKCTREELARSILGPWPRPRQRPAWRSSLRRSRRRAFIAWVTVSLWDATPWSG